MQAYGRNKHRSTIAVVTGIVDVLQANRGVKALPKMQSVIGFLNGFPPVIKTAIAQQKAISAQRQKFLVISRNAVRNKNDPGAVEFSAPALAGCSRAQLRGAVHFGVGVGLMATFIPAPPPENTKPVIERLFEICAETVLYGGEQRMGGYFRNGS